MESINCPSNAILIEYTGPIKLSTLKPVKNIIMVHPPLIFTALKPPNVITLDDPPDKLPTDPK